MNAEQAVEWFDASCMLGRWEGHTPGAPATASELVETLRSCGIGEALVYHSVAALINPQEGNERLMAEIAEFPALHPCWVVLPHHTHEVEPPEELVNHMLASGVRAARIFPHDYRVILRRWSVGRLFAPLAAQHIPLFVDFGHRGWSEELIDWDGVYESCSSFPDLPVILVRASLASNRRLFPLLEQCPNLYIETSYYAVHRGIERVCQDFGAERLLFGSGLPQRAPGPAITALSYSRISDRERALIAGGNLRRLLAEVRA